VYPDSTDTLGWRLGADGFRIVLTAELAEVVERRLNGSVTAFLGGHGLTVDDIGSWICHPGGPKVLDAAQRALKLPDSALTASRRSLSEAGNMSSVSVLHILELTAEEDPPPPGSFGLMIGLGPGVSAELLLLRWLCHDCLLDAAGRHRVRAGRRTRRVGAACERTAAARRRRVRLRPLPCDDRPARRAARRLRA
jgi:predicted naringenin-chalcone synthase